MELSTSLLNEIVMFSLSKPEELLGDKTTLVDGSIKELLSITAEKLNDSTLMDSENISVRLPELKSNVSKLINCGLKLSSSKSTACLAASSGIATTLLLLESNANDDVNEMKQFSILSHKGISIISL